MEGKHSYAIHEHIFKQCQNREDWHLIYALEVTQKQPTYTWIELKQSFIYWENPNFSLL